MLKFSVCGAGGGGGGGGYFFVVVLMLFPNSKLTTKSFSCQTNRIWKNIFIDNIFIFIDNIFIFNTNIFI